MLSKAIDKDGRNWDQLLPYLLFAVREVPQSSTGFPRFDLLYSHKPRGLLDIAKEAWEEQPCPHRTLIEHVLGMWDWMTAVYPIVKEHMEKAQRDQSATYNQSTQHREFKPGDSALVLVPTVECKVLATWNCLCLFRWCGYSEPGLGQPSTSGAKGPELPPSSWLDSEPQEM